MWNARRPAALPPAPSLWEGEFGFTASDMNSPRFNPVRAARPTLEQLGLISAQACDGMAELTPGLGDASISKAFRDAMTEWKLVTNASSNPNGTAVHTGKIASAPPGATWWMDGPLLISTGLPWASVSGANPAATPAGSLSPETQAAIEKLMGVGPIIAAASAGVSEAQKMLTGEASQADRFQTGVVTLLADGGWTGDVWRVDAEFGVFGSLPLVGVTFSDAYVLLDSVNGNVDGPFSLSSDLDGRQLLLLHGTEFAAGSLVRYSGVLGCPKIVRSQWFPTPPPGGPWLPKVACPTCPAPPWALPGAIQCSLPFNPANAGWLTDWHCTSTTVNATVAFCDCWRYGRSENAAGNGIFTREHCQLNYACSVGPPGTAPPGSPCPIQHPGSGMPPFATPGPAIAPGAAWVCTVVEYWY